MPIFRNRTVILIVLTGVAIVLGAAAAILWKAPTEPAGHHASGFPWAVFLPLWIVIIAANRRRKTLAQALDKNKDTGETNI